MLESKRQDEFLNQSLALAVKNMRNAGYELHNDVIIEIDPNLQYMGYVKIESRSLNEGLSSIVVADWALDSAMLHGFILHELSHIYYTEINSPSHQTDVIDEVLNLIIENEGLSNLESRSLNEGFNHLQNIIVDDIVFQLMNNTRDIKLIQEFFLTWMSDQPTGNNVLDTSLLARNAFARASLKRHNIFHEVSDQMNIKNERFLSFYEHSNKQSFEIFEDFLVNFNLNDMDDFSTKLLEYFELMITLLRPDKSVETLK